MPVPRFISASCGISVRIRPDRRENAEEIFRESSKLTPEDYAYYHVLRDPETGDIPCSQRAWPVYFARMTQAVTSPSPD